MHNPKKMALRVASLYLSKLNTDEFMDVNPDGSVTITSINAIPPRVWEMFSRNMRALGYEYRGAEDAKKLTIRSKKNGLMLLKDDHAKAFKSSVGLSEMFVPEKLDGNIIQKALDRYGLTHNPSEAGYLLTDGRMLDFSEKNHGGPGSGRVLDHRQITEILPDMGQTEAMKKFMEYGNIRLKCNGSEFGFDIRKKPSTAQLDTIEDLLFKYQNKNVYVDLPHESREFKSHEPEEIMSFIKSWLKWASMLLIRTPILPSVPLEKPTARAVEALISENPISSGWHSGFNKDFNNLEPSWAIVFKGNLSHVAVEAAKKAGLSVNTREIIRGTGASVSDVYLPGAGKGDARKAEEVFNKFAESYRKLRGKVSSIINSSLNWDSKVVATIKKTPIT